VFVVVVGWIIKESVTVSIMTVVIAIIVGIKTGSVV
jgi:hypothetical protein